MLENMTPIEKTQNKEKMIKPRYFVSLRAKMNKMTQIMTAQMPRIRLTCRLPIIALMMTEQRQAIKIPRRS